MPRPERILISAVFAAVFVALILAFRTKPGEDYVETIMLAFLAILITAAIFAAYFVAPWETIREFIGL